MDEYTILKKKSKKNGFASTALLISIAVALIAMVGAVLILGKVDNQKVNATDENSTVEEVTRKDTTSNTSDVTCEGLSSEIQFNDNLKTIKEAAISYFTNERLPQKKGDTVKISLKEMQDKKLVLNIRDASGKTCNSNNSYVEVTKEDDEYLMKIFLSCNDLEDYIIVHLGCYDYCDTDACEKKDEKEYEYEYKKVTSCTMSDWSNWGEWKTKREKTSNYKKEDTKTETTTKEVVKKVDAKTTVTYNCDKYPGYKLVGDKCVKETVVTETKEATPSKYSYNCDKYPGYKLVGKYCVKEESKEVSVDAVVSPITYSCPKGYNLVGKKCERTVTKTETKDATRSCPTGYTLSGNKCTKEIKTTDTKSAEAIYGTRTVSGTTTCYKTNCTTKTVFNCPQGKSCGNYPVTSCEKVQSTCSTQHEEKYISGYRCSNGYTLSGKKCTKTTTTIDTKDASLSCPSGFNLSGTTCTRNYKETEVIDAKANPIVYSCPTGYTLRGVRCFKTVKVTDTKTATKIEGGYVCPDGYTQSGKKCTKEIIITDKENATKNVKYTCPTGYTRKDKACTKTVQETITKTYYRYATRTCNGGSTSIKWSLSKNDSYLLNEGYKLTGNKRVVIVK